MRNPSKKSNNRIEGYFIMIELNNKIKKFNLKDDRFIHHLFDYLKDSKKKLKKQKLIVFSYSKNTFLIQTQLF